MNPLLHAALHWHASGVSVVPARNDSSKRPADFWKQYQTQRADVAEVHSWFSNGANYGLGVVCGTVSGQLEMYEFEGRAVDEGLVGKFTQAMMDHGLKDLWFRLLAGYLERSPSGGSHLFYRVVDGEPRGNTKLARRPATKAELADNPDEKIKVLIETRGEGGFVVIAPTPGTHQPSGNPWAVVTGSPATIPTITAEERDNLFAIATLFDELPARASLPAMERGARSSATGNRPGDIYNAQTSWDDILIPQGWTRVYPIGAGWAWRRPGKNHGISATTGTRPDTGDNLYVFTTSTEFDSEEPYSKFGAYTLLKHGGDFKAAAKALAPPKSGKVIPIRPGMSTTTGTTATSTTGTTTTAGTSLFDGNIAVAVVLPPTVGIPATLTDAGNADLFAEQHHDELRYVPIRDAWLRWTGTHWHQCENNGEAMIAARATVDAIPEDDPDVTAHKRRSLSRRAIEAIVGLGRHNQAIRVESSRLDADPFALNTPTGTVDLHTGVVRACDPADLITKCTRFGYDPDATAPLWAAFLDYTFSGDETLAPFLQRLCGYSASGMVSEHVVPFLHGDGKNGKTVFLNVVGKILNNYCEPAPMGFLMANGREDESATAGLAGLRMVIASEVNRKDVFDEAKFKMLTGGDQIKARFLFQNHFTFTPSHTLWLMGNHKPRVEAGGESFWRRLALVPFNHQVPEEDRIPDYDRKLLEADGPGILTWIVQGAIIAFGQGLQIPDSVREETQLYSQEEDALERFIEARCHVGGGVNVKIETKRIRAAYESWSAAEGERDVLSPQAFGRELRSRWNISTTKSNGKHFYTNMALLTDQDEPPRWDER
jgi:P4 family phage/plasmid primase-like protien